MAQVRCYVASSNSVSPVDSFGPCSASNYSTPIVSCCNTGHTCLSNGLCQYDDVPSTGSGFYVGGCTDPTFKDPACHSFCKSLPMTEAVFANGTWSCCGSVNGVPTCNSPAGPTFSDPSPFQLFKLSKVEGSPPSAFSLFPSDVPAVSDVQAGSAAATSAADVIASPSASPTTTASSSFGTGSFDTSLAPIVGPTASPTSHSLIDGLSSAAIAGIAVGGAFGLVLMGLLIYMIVLLRRSAKRHAQQEEFRSAQFARQKSCSECSSNGNSDSGMASQHTLLLEAAASPRPPPELETFRFRQDSLSPRPLRVERPLRISRPIPAPIYVPVPITTPTPASAPIQELFSPSFQPELERPPLRYELRATGSVNEMMAATRTEDRMAGGGPDKALPNLPPVAERRFSRTERWVRRTASMEKYEWI